MAKMSVEELLNALEQSGVDTQEKLTAILGYAGPVFEINQRQQRIEALKLKRAEVIQQYDAEIIAEQQAIEQLQQAIRPQV